MSISTSVLLLIGLIGLNAYFVAAEFALVSSRRDKLETLRDSGYPRAQRVIDATEHLSFMLVTCQLGITVASLLLGKISEPAVAHVLHHPLAWVGMTNPMWVHAISFACALALISYLHILFGEMVPKNFALAGPEQAALLIVPPLFLITRICRPLIRVFTVIANGTLRILFRVEAREEVERTITATQLTAMIGESSGEGLIDAEETMRLDRALRSSDRPVSAVIIPVENMRTVSLTQGVLPLTEFQRIVKETGYSRYPVRSDHGDYLGFLHIKDVLYALKDPTQEDHLIPANVIRPLPTFPGDATIDSVSARMRRTHSHLAVVTDPETDVIIGFVALEDLMEEFVGTVRDSTHRIPE